MGYALGVSIALNLVLGFGFWFLHRFLLSSAAKWKALQDNIGTMQDATGKILTGSMALRHRVAFLEAQDRAWAEAVIAEGVDVVRRVTTRAVARRDQLLGRGTLQ